MRNPADPGTGDVDVLPSDLCKLSLLKNEGCRRLGTGEGGFACFCPAWLLDEFHQHQQGKQENNGRHHFPRPQARSFSNFCRSFPDQIGILIHGFRLPLESGFFRGCEGTRLNYTIIIGLIQTKLWVSEGQSRKSPTSLIVQLFCR